MLLVVVRCNRRTPTTRSTLTRMAFPSVLATIHALIHSYAPCGKIGCWCYWWAVQKIRMQQLFPRRGWWGLRLSAREKWKWFGCGPGLGCVACANDDGAWVGFVAPCNATCNVLWAITIYCIHKLSSSYTRLLSSQKKSPGLERRTTPGARINIYWMKNGNKIEKSIRPPPVLLLSSL